METSRICLPFSNRGGNYVHCLDGTMEDSRLLPISLKCTVSSCPLLGAQKPLFPSSQGNLQDLVKYLRSQIGITMAKPFLPRVCLGSVHQSRTRAWLTTECCRRRIMMRMQVWVLSFYYRKGPAWLSVF